MSGVGSAGFEGRGCWRRGLDRLEFWIGNSWKRRGRRGRMLLRKEEEEGRQGY